MQIIIFLSCLLALSSLEEVVGKCVNVVVGPGLTYDPKKLEINVGDTVVWRWAYPAILGVAVGEAPHMVTKSFSYDRKCDFVEETSTNNYGMFNSGHQFSGYVFNVTFLEPEEVTYHCQTTGRTNFNCKRGMWGQIIVKENGANTEIVDLSKYHWEANPAVPRVLQQAVNTGVNFFAHLLGFV